jgi:hypothetical protein
MLAPFWAAECLLVGEWGKKQLYIYIHIMWIKQGHKPPILGMVNTNTPSMVMTGGWFNHETYGDVINDGRLMFNYSDLTRF